MRQRGLSFKEAVNSSLRAALSSSVPRADYVFPMPPCIGGHLRPGFRAVRHHGASAHL